MVWIITIGGVLVAYAVLIISVVVCCRSVRKSLEMADESRFELFQTLMKVKRRRD